MYKTSRSQVKIVMILDWADIAPGTSQTTKIWAVSFEHNNLSVYFSAMMVGTQNPTSGYHKLV